MTDTELPDALRTFVDATNSGDTDAFVAAFTDDAYLDDWGREFRGHDGVRSWDRTDNIGKHAHFDVVSFEPGESAGAWALTLTVTSERFNGTGTLRFQLRDNLIAELVIS